MSFDQIERAVALFAGLGVEHVRITGGEPLVRRGIEDLVARLANLTGISDLSLSTNAVRLARFAEKLKYAGLHRLNVSLDTLDDRQYSELTGGKLAKVLQGLEEARKVGLSPIKINCVLMKGVNENEVERLIDYCALNGFTLRLIETMPMGNTGRLIRSKYLALDAVKTRLQQKYELVPDIMPGAGPARYFRLQGSSIKIGFITPISQHFCETCNRVRLSCEGDIYTCLGDEARYPLRTYLGEDYTDEELLQHIRNAVNLKPEKHEFMNRHKRIVRFMAMTGG